eukprot:CAMPEP_0198249700 /NCGR_PEP_ID=MMETSP1447-20131203/1133_1 /TAXON_ID=420782 /ORGANISM="Chaetoceros dichaeta, Strain CCMP1751" /LENGTH=116 /DNA_ID=CAMNT_0043934387 /DNA_START=59 /DNA_END=409 /DNA_ORIENTATION=-
MSMLSRTAASTLRNGGRTFLRQQAQQPSLQLQQRRTMGGGAHWLSVSKTHTRLGEAFGFVCWMWIFHRTRCDGPVVMGWRHPWEHAEDPWAHARGGDDHGHGHGAGHGEEAHSAEE